MITVYGADWCEDTRRTLRHLRRLGIAHRYYNIDEDSRALRRARELNPDPARRTPVVDVGLGGPPLVEPDTDLLTEALVEREMLTMEDAAERMAVQNVGDLERVVRTAAGVLLMGASAAAPGRVKSVVRLAGGVVALSGISGWCPAYQAAGLTSIGGVGDRPLEATRSTWLEGNLRGKQLGPAERGGEELR